MRKLPWRYSADNRIASLSITPDVLQQVAAGEFENCQSQGSVLRDAMVDYAANAYTGDWSRDQGETSGLKDVLSKRMRGIYKFAQDALAKSRADATLGENVKSIVPRFEDEQTFGYRVNRMRYAAKDPFCFSRRVWDSEIDEGTTATVRVMIGFGGSCMTDTKQLAGAVTSALAYVEALQKAGRNVEVFGTILIGTNPYGNDKIAHISYDLTNCSPQQICALLMSGQVFRTFGYPIMDTIPKEKEFRFRSCYGFVLNLESHRRRTMKTEIASIRDRLKAASLLADHDIFIPSFATEDDVKRAFAGEAIETWA